MKTNEIKLRRKTKKECWCPKEMHPIKDCKCPIHCVCEREDCSCFITEDGCLCIMCFGEELCVDCDNCLKEVNETEVKKDIIAILQDRIDSQPRWVKIGGWFMRFSLFKRFTYWLAKITVV